jgi:ATP-dependent protease HslVU (ClpYQ) ATPase subunit
MSDEVGAVVQQVVNDAADEAVAAVQQEHAVEVAADRVEAAAERVEDAAAHTDQAHAAPAITRDDLHSIIAEHVGPLHDRISALETPAPAAEDVAQETADATVAAIVDEVEQRAEDAEDELTGDLGDGVTGDTPDASDVAEILAPDTPPRKTHFMHRPLIGG